MEFHLDWLEFWTFLYCVKKRNPYVKIFKKIYFLPVKIKIHTWKNPKICWWKILLPVKSCKILCVKAIFCTWKNSIKGQKYVSRTLLIFTGKKNAAPLNLRSYFPVPKYLVLLVFVCVICICDFRAWWESTFFICLARRGVVQGLKLSPRWHKLIHRDLKLTQNGQRLTFWAKKINPTILKLNFQ